MRKIKRVTIKINPERSARLEEWSHMLKRMAKIEELIFDPTAQRPSGSIIRIVDGLQIFVELSDNTHGNVKQKTKK